MFPFLLRIESSSSFEYRGVRALSINVQIIVVRIVYYNIRYSTLNELYINRKFNEEFRERRNKRLFVKKKKKIIRRDLFEIFYHYKVHG